MSAEAQAVQGLSTIYFQAKGTSTPQTARAATLPPPSLMPWKLPVPSPAPKTPNVSGPSGIKGNAIYNIYITGKTNVTYAVSVIE